MTESPDNLATEFLSSKRRNKKASHPVWNLFVELKSPSGSAQIKCKFCDFETSDKNFLSLISHIRQSHSEGTESLWSFLKKESNEYIKYKTNRQSLNSLLSQDRVKSESGGLEELSKQVATFGSVTMNQNDIVGLLQNYAKGGSSLEGLVSALAEKPSTSTSKLYTESGNNDDDDDEIYVIEKSTSPPKVADDWVLVATFNSYDEVEAARTAGRVVRHTIIPTATGSKVKYRCNQWKRSHCPFRMHYVEEGGKYYLYQKGGHDHTPLGKQTAPAIKVPTPSSSSSRPRRSKAAKEEKQQQQQFMETDYLQSIISHAIHATTSVAPQTEFTSPPIIVKEPSPKIEPEASPCLTLPENLLNVFQEAVTTEPNEIFTLSNSISNLLEVATQLRLVFTFDSRNAAEFCFSQTGNPQMIVFVDVGPEVIVKARHNDMIISEERWRKADSAQFIWAVRGILTKTFS